MSSSENNDFIFKNCEIHKMHLHHAYHTSMTCVIVLSLQTSLLLTRNMNVTVAKELYYVFSEISKFLYWYLFIDAEYIYDPDHPNVLLSTLLGFSMFCCLFLKISSF